MQVSAIVDHALFEIEYAKKNIQDFSEEEETVVPQIYEKALDLIFHVVEVEKPFNLVIRWIEPGGYETGPAQGMGDISNAVKTLKLFQKHFPNANHYLTNKFYDAEPYQRSSYETVTLEAENELFLGVLQPTSLPGHLKTSRSNIPTIMFDVATPDHTIWPFSIYDLDRGGSALIGCYHVDEYNGERTADRPCFYRTNHGWYSYGIGLAQDLSPCVGIHVEEMQEVKQLRKNRILREIEDSSFATFLKKYDVFSSKKPGELYFGYRSEDDRGYWLRYLNSVIRYDLMKEGSHDLNFVFVTQKDTTFEFDWWTETFQEMYKQSPFSRLILVEQGDQMKEKEVQLNPEGKRTLRVLQWKKRIPKNDMSLMMRVSGDLLLVTGDQSWVEALSLKDKVIFYEVRRWKVDFANEMRKIGSYQFGDKSHIHEFLDLMALSANKSDWGPTWVSEKIAKMMLNPAFRAQHRQYVEMLHAKYNSVHWLVGKIKRRICQYHLPRIGELESKFVNLMESGQHEAAIKTAQKIQELAKVQLQEYTLPQTRSRKRRKIEENPKPVEKPSQMKFTVHPFRHQFMKKVEAFYHSFK